MKKYLKRLGLILVSLFVMAIVIGVIVLRLNYVVPILMYHHIDEHAQETKLSVSPKSFARQMKFLRQHNYNVISLEELVGLMKEGKNFPPRTVAITFDDGYEDNYSLAYPILKEYKIPATIFIPIKNMGKTGHLSWRQIDRMSKDDIAIGSHTYSDKRLPDLKEEEARWEIFKSKQVIEKKTDQEVIFFSYPLGGFDQRIQEIVKEAGYLGAVATNPGKRAPPDDIYALKRIRISRTSDNLLVFWIESSGYYTFIKEHRDED